MIGEIEIGFAKLCQHPLKIEETRPVCVDEDAQRAGHAQTPALCFCAAVPVVDE